MATKEELLAKAAEPAREAMRLHPFYRGKIRTALKCPVRDFSAFALWYTPGVAAPCRAIGEEPSLVYELTNKGNTIAVVSDGSRVLGLGNIGPEAGLPVMEGKALLFKYLGGVDAVPLCLRAGDPDSLIRTVEALEPSFGGINLEDISQPNCFRVLDSLRQARQRRENCERRCGRRLRTGSGTPYSRVWRFGSLTWQPIHRVAGSSQGAAKWPSMRNDS